MLSLWKWLCNRNKIAVTHIDNHTNTKGTTQPAIQLSQSKDDTNETCPTEVHIPTAYPHWIDVLLNKKHPDTSVVYLNVLTHVKRTELVHYSALRHLYTHPTIVYGANNTDISVDITFDPVHYTYQYYMYSDGMLIQQTTPNSKYNTLVINDMITFDTSGTKHVKPCLD